MATERRHLHPDLYFAQVCHLIISLRIYHFIGYDMKIQNIKIHNLMRTQVNSIIIYNFNTLLYQIFKNVTKFDFTQCEFL